MSFKNKLWLRKGLIVVPDASQLDIALWYQISQLYLLIAEMKEEQNEGSICHTSVNEEKVGPTIEEAEH